MSKIFWNDAKKKIPTKSGRYMCVCEPIVDDDYEVECIYFTMDLSKLAPGEFKNEKRPGWVEWNCEYGYAEIKDVMYWLPLPSKPD